MKRDRPQEEMMISSWTRLDMFQYYRHYRIFMSRPCVELHRWVPYERVISSLWVSRLRSLQTLWIRWCLLVFVDGIWRTSLKHTGSIWKKLVDYSWPPNLLHSSFNQKASKACPRQFPGIERIALLAQPGTWRSRRQVGPDSGWVHGGEKTQWRCPR